MKITFSNVQPNSKESKIWLDEKGQLRTYNQKQQKWAHGTVSSEPDDKPEDTPEVPREIKFTIPSIGNIEFTAMSNMTWNDWCVSEYNPYQYENIDQNLIEIYTWYDEEAPSEPVTVDMYELNIGMPAPDMIDSFVLYFDGKMVTAMDTIVENGVYERGDL